MTVITYGGMRKSFVAPRLSRKAMKFCQEEVCAECQTPILVHKEGLKTAQALAKRPGCELRLLCEKCTGKHMVQSPDTPAFNLHSPEFSAAMREHRAEQN